MKFHISVLIFFYALLNILSCTDSPKPDPRIPIIIDADTANEVDDLFALVRAIVEPKFNLLGITSAQFHISPYATDTTVLESQKINEDLLKLMKREDIPLPIGSNLPMQSINEPALSPAADFIIEKAHELPADKKLQLVILGPCTNVASAILKDSTIIPKIQVHYIGFWHDVEENSYNKKEFNSGNDTLAVEVLLNTEGLDFNVMTATTCQHLVFEKTDVDAHLKGKSELGDYLVDRWESYTRWWTKEDTLKERWIMWDVAIIEALAHPELATIKSFKTPPENTPRMIDIYDGIEVEKMIADFWQSLEKK